MLDEVKFAQFCIYTKILVVKLQQNLVQLCWKYFHYLLKRQTKQAYIFS